MTDNSLQAAPIAPSERIVSLDVLRGFAVALPAVEQWLGAGTLPLRFIPGPPSSADAITASVAFTGWIVDLDSAGSTPPAAAEARAIRTQFRRAFALTTGTIMLAAGAVAAQAPLLPPWER